MEGAVLTPASLTPSPSGPGVPETLKAEGHIFLKTVYKIKDVQQVAH